VRVQAEANLLFRNRVVTYGELREQVARGCRRAAGRGGPGGGRAGIFSENNPFFVAAYLGIVRTGLTAVPFQTEVSANTFSEIARSTGMKNRLYFKSLLFVQPCSPKFFSLRLHPVEEAI